jgi:hypothetical protein
MLMLEAYNCAVLRVVPMLPVSLGNEKHAAGDYALWPTAWIEHVGCVQCVASGAWVRKQTRQGRRKVVLMR